MSHRCTSWSWERRNFRSRCAQLYAHSQSLATCGPAGVNAGRLHSLRPDRRSRHPAVSGPIAPSQSTNYAFGFSRTRPASSTSNFECTQLPLIVRVLDVNGAERNIGTAEGDVVIGRINAGYFQDLYRDLGQGAGPAVSPGCALAVARSRRTPMGAKPGGCRDSLVKLLLAFERASVSAERTGRGGDAGQEAGQTQLSAWLTALGRTGIQ